jgi:hypothetical protein
MALKITKYEDKDIDGWQTLTIEFMAETVNDLATISVIASNHINAWCVETNFILNKSYAGMDLIMLVRYKDGEKVKLSIQLP